MTTFVAVDGESYTIKGDHRYVLMADSTGRYDYDGNGLSTVRCFEFLLSLPKGTAVAYGWNYDVNMILRDVPIPLLRDLWETGRIRWNSYSIEWIPNKWFAVRIGTRRCKISDVFGFFQSSFVKALEKWGIPAQSDLEEMKSKRSLFDAEMKAQIIRYCIGECNDLVRLMNLLQAALVAVDISLRSWVGAGSIAAALLKREGVSDHHSYEAEFPKPVADAINRAYFGGRTEVFQQGNFERLWDYDISSAYPSEAMHLSSLVGGEWLQAARYSAAAEFAVWEVSWNVSAQSVVMPFPFRKGSDIYYPSRGRGWYHSNEVAAARAIYGQKIKVHRGYVFQPGGNTKPFQFIEPLYQYRQSLKRESHGGEKVLKLGLNAIYGKLAQGYGYAGKQPAFQSYYWAGRITAGTRSRVLRLAAGGRGSIAMVATDGIFYGSGGVDVAGFDDSRSHSEGLGSLELTIMDDVFVAQPGVYSAVVDGEMYGRSRGFFSREIDFGELRDGFASDGPHYVGSYEATRFCGLGACIVRNNFDGWRKWLTTLRRLSLYPSRKFLDVDGPDNPVRHLPPSTDGKKLSGRYTPKGGNLRSGDPSDPSLIEYVEGCEQPLRDYG